jgi:hypothetical protein
MVIETSLETRCSAISAPARDSDAASRWRLRMRNGGINRCVQDCSNVTPRQRRRGMTMPRRGGAVGARHAVPRRQAMIALPQRQPEMHLKPLLH